VRAGGLLDGAMAAHAPCELISSVTRTNGRELHVRRWMTAISLTYDQTIHTGWTLMLVIACVGCATRSTGP
jgi:hypothetical protein